MNPMVNLALAGAAGASIAPARTAVRRPGCDPHAGFASGRAACPDGSGVLEDLSGSLRQPGRLAQPMRPAALLEEQDILLGIAAKGKRSALARIAAHLGERVDMSQGAILAAMLRRERLGSTAIGRGIAIPHARLDGIATPKAVIATLRRPVWFDAPDSKSVDLLLALLWPSYDSTGFLPALASFCRLLRHTELRERLRASETPAEALAWMKPCGKGALAEPRRYGRRGATARMCEVPDKRQ
jgi:PTS system nitrogen regulatory IIA component